MLSVREWRFFSFLYPSLRCSFPLSSFFCSCFWACFFSFLVCEQVRTAAVLWRRWSPVHFESCLSPWSPVPVGRDPSQSVNWFCQSDSHWGMKLMFWFTLAPAHQFPSWGHKPFSLLSSSLIKVINDTSWFPPALIFMLHGVELQHVQSLPELNLLVNWWSLVNWWRLVSGNQPVDSSDYNWLMTNGKLAFVSLSVVTLFLFELGLVGLIDDNWQTTDDKTDWLKERE